MTNSKSGAPSLQTSSIGKSSMKNSGTAKGFMKPSD